MTLRGGWRLLACSACLASHAVSAEPASGWTEQVTLAGDLRLRYESIRKEPGADDDRGRYRARFGLRIDATDAVEFGIRLASGDGNPVSTNLTFGKSFSADNVRIDRAYVAWSVNDTLTLTAGKMKNPLTRVGDNPLLWDSDLNPEGVAASFASGRFAGTAGTFRLDDRDDGVESWLYAAQAEVEFDVSASTTLSAGIGWFDYTGVAGKAPLFGDDANGNSVDAAGNYLNDYDILEFFAEYESAVGHWPVTVFADWARNTRAARADTAWATGVIFGKAEEAGSAEWSWEWRDTEADALVGIFTDSDLADGNTDSHGHVLQGTYMLTGHVALAATLIFSEYGLIDDPHTDFDRVMLDIEFSF
jgi:hypothetical protein